MGIDNEQHMQKKPCVVRLGTEDRDRLDYICKQCKQSKAAVIRMLIHHVSNGGFTAKGFSAEFDPYPGED